MTNNDFDKIIYESFDHLDTPHSYFEGKRKQYEIVPQEYVTGLRKSFERLRLPFNTVIDKIFDGNKTYSVEKLSLPIVTTSVETLILQNRIKRRLGNNISSHLFDMIETAFYNYLLNLESLTTPQQDKSASDKEPDQMIHLKDVFESISKYKFIMELLVEKQFIQPNSYIWKDEKKGCKSLLVSILKYLNWQKYYNITSISNIQIQAIAKMTFNVEIGIDTIKHAKPNNFDFSYIPLASTLPNT